MRSVFALGAVVAWGCTGEITGGEPDLGTPDAGSEVARVAIALPAPGSVHMRDDLDGFGALAAMIDVAVDATGPIARIDISAGAAPAQAGPAATVGVRAPGMHIIRAVAYDDANTVVAMDQVAIVVADPDVANCFEWLDLYQLDWAPANPRQGVEQPVTMTVPINGVSNRYVANADPRPNFFMDCQLALALARAAPYLRERQVVELVDIGVYNYRCIGGGDPPDCPNGMSQHAFARAIDIAGFTTDDGQFYSVDDDWVIDPDAEPTCSAATDGPKDAWLHDIICAMKTDGVWNIALTPNYNAGHRDHFHVDLKPGSDFIRRRH